MEKQLEQSVINRMMDNAIQINKQCRQQCRDFSIMVSPMRKNTLLLRWTTINIDTIDNPVQCYHYECFNPDGTSQNCSVNYSNQQEANEFFWSLKTLYKQEFAKDHTILKQDTGNKKQDMENRSPDS